MAEPSAQNLVQLLLHQAERLGSRPALRYRRHGLFHDVSWNAYRADVLACAAALLDAGIEVGDRVGLLAENRPEWLIADLAIMAAGAANVPPHAPLTESQIQYQLADAGVRWAFVSTAKQLSKLLQVRHRLPMLKGIVALDSQSDRDILSWSGFLQRGRQRFATRRTELYRRIDLLNEDSLATVMYTSGTTGNPKGVMLTHGNLLSNTLAVRAVFPLDPDAIKLSWLPYSHIYARTVDHYLHLASGIVLCLSESAETVVQDLHDIEPTHMSAVPRFYEKALTAVASPDPSQTGQRLLKIFGSRICWLGSGGAPLPVAVAQAYLDAGLPVLQGYGLTESSPVISFNRTEHFKIETVGQAIPGVEIAIAPDGEVLTRGPHVMKGYWNDPAGTAQAIRHGWLHTGDTGRLDEEGFLTITGRKKDLLALSNGKKVVPTWIEGRLLAEPCIDQAVVYGEGRSFLTALIVPHWENVQKALGGSVGGASAELVNDLRVIAVMRKRVDRALADVASWEKVKRFVLLARPFSVEAGELTVSMKLRRGVLFERYRAELERLYCGETP